MFWFSLSWLTAAVIIILIVCVSWRWRWCGGSLGVDLSGISGVSDAKPHPSTFLTTHEQYITKSEHTWCVCFSTNVSNSHLLCLSFFACVLVRPSKPRCSIEGSPYFGNEVVLKCKSADGTSPMQYSWEKTTDSKLLPANAVLGKKTKASSPSYCREKWIKGSMNLLLIIE